MTRTADAMSSQTVPAKPPKRSTWRRLYFLLASFNVITVCLALFLSHELMGIYTHSVAVNAEWVQRGKEYARLSSLAAHVNAPGNDIFDSDDVALERERLTRASRAFDAHMVTVRRELQAHVAEPHRSGFDKRLVDVDAAMREMTDEAGTIFDYFGNNAAAAAGKRMASMDRAYYRLNERIEELRLHVKRVQDDLFNQQLAVAERLRLLEGLLAAMILLMVGAAVFYGRRIARETERNFIERERHVAELERAQGALAAASDDLEDRIEQRTRQLQESEQRMRAIVANAHDAFVGMDARGTITDWNAQAEATFGWTAHEAIGQPLHALIIPQRLRDRHVDGLWRFHHTGENTVLNRLVQFPALHRAGHEFPVELTISPLQTGTTHVFSAFLRDITEREQSEEVQAKFAAIIASSTDAIISKTLDGIITSWNRGAEKIFGYTAQEAVGQSMAMLIPPERSGEEAQILARIARGEGIEHFETVRVTNDGTRIDMEATISPIHDASGNIIGASKIARDITNRKRVQEELDRFFSLSLDMLCIASSDGYFMRLNPAWEAVLGYSRDELMRRPFLDFVHPDDREATIAVTQEFAEGRETRAFENRYRCKDGSWKWLRWQAAPNSDRSVIYAAAHDITEARAARELLQAQAASLAEAQRIARLGNWEWEVASDTVRWSDQMYRVFGIKPADFTPSYCGYLERVHPDDRERVEELVSRCLTEKVPMNFEHRTIVPDGSVRHIQARTRIALDGAGNPVKLFGTAQDITELTRIERGLQASEERFQIVSQATNDVIWDWDMATGVVSYNRAFSEDFLPATSQYSPTTALPMENLHPDDRPRVQASIEALLASDADTWMEEYRLRLADGAYAHVFDRARVQRDAHGVATRMVGSMMNITRQKQQEAVLRQATEAAEDANRAKSEFLANMSHEIRTPMNGVLGTIGLLLDSPLSPTQRELAGLARHSGESLLNLINDILDFSKIEAGKLMLEPIPFDLLRAAEDVTDMMAATAAGKRLDLILRYAPDVPRHVVGDPGRIRQVLTNLLGNAIKFTDAGQVLLDIEAEAQDEHAVSLRIRVEDTGIGVSEEQRAQIFDKFTQGDASTTRRHGGTGLGLAISAQLVEMMGGRIGADSQPGAGSTFWFTLRLPLQQDAPAPPLPLADLAGVRVLVVDDNAVNRRVLHEQVIAWKMRNGSCASAEEALRILRAAHAAGDPYGIAILDYQMPDIDGEMLGRAIKADPALRDVVLVMLTSLGQRGDVVRLRTLGFAAYLVKPARQSELLAALGRVWTARVHGEAPAMVTRHTLLEDRGVGHGRTAWDAFHARVLVAEDHPTNQLVASMMLRNLGCEVDLAGNGREAVAMVAQAPYDVVFMDCEMPVMDGFAATAEIRGRGDATARVPIIAVTAQAMQGDRERCLRAGMDDYISKPVQAADFAAALARWAPARRTLGAARSVAGAGEEATGTPPSDTLDAAVIAQLRALAAETDASLLRQVCDSFRRDGAKRIATLQEAAGSGDVEVVRQTAHALKGASVNIGARALAALAGQLETGAEIGAATEATLIAQLQAEFARVDAALDAIAPDAATPEKGVS